MYQGDPRIILGPDGSRLQFIGGQPLMDKGLENRAIISLFTSPGWCGNKFMKTHIGSDFETECNKPITRQQLNRIREAAERALGGDAVVTVSNPSGHRLAVHIKIAGSTDISLMRDGGNWSSQRTEPAYPHIRQQPWEQALMFEDSQVVTDADDAPMRY